MTMNGIFEKAAFYAMDLAHTLKGKASPVEDDIYSAYVTIPYSKTERHGHENIPGTLNLRITIEDHRGEPLGQLVYRYKLENVADVPPQHRLDVLEGLARATENQGDKTTRGYVDGNNKLHFLSSYCIPEKYTSGEDFAVYSLVDEADRIYKEISTLVHRSYMEL